MDLINQCYKAINEEIAKEFRYEAKNIIRLLDNDKLKEFLKYHEEDKGNICCLMLDFEKQRLVKEGKLEQKENDNFGKEFI